MKEAVQIEPNSVPDFTDFALCLGMAVLGRASTVEEDAEISWLLGEQNRCHEAALRLSGLDFSDKEIVISSLRQRALDVRVKMASALWRLCEPRG
jgi:hypothetical protein